MMYATQSFRKSQKPTGTYGNSQFLVRLSISYNHILLKLCFFIEFLTSAFPHRKLLTLKVKNGCPFSPKVSTCQQTYSAFWSSQFHLYTHNFPLIYSTNKYLVKLMGLLLCLNFNHFTVNSYCPRGSKAKKVTIIVIYSQ